MNSSLCLKPSSLKGRIELPSSKSHTLRALVFATLARGKSTIFGYLHSPDTFSMIEACKVLGADISVFHDRLEVKGNLRGAEDVILAGNSGQVLRFIGAISALTSTYTVITGDYSIRHNRVVRPLLEGLSQLGAFAVSSREDGHAPIIIKGPLRGGCAYVCGEDSQPISGLLIASAFSSYKTELFVDNPGEIPWVNLTLSWFDRLGICYTQNNFEHYVLPGKAAIEGFEYQVPCDLSALAYPLVASIITNSAFTITNFSLDPTQGDGELIAFLKQKGANLEFDEARRELHLFKGSYFEGGKINANRFIDAVPILAVLSCFAKQRVEICGAKIARKKESDRISCITKELRKMGALIEEKEEGMIIEPSFLKGAVLESHADHRIALSLAVAALAAQSSSILQDFQCVNKSYRQFFEHLKSLGAQIEE